MSDSFLELRNLKKSFTSEEYVLQGINLQIDQGIRHLAAVLPAAARRPLFASSQDLSSRTAEVYGWRGKM